MEWGSKEELLALLCKIQGNETIEMKSSLPIHSSDASTLPRKVSGEYPASSQNLASRTVALSTFSAGSQVLCLSGHWNHCICILALQSLDVVDMHTRTRYCRMNQKNVVKRWQQELFDSYVQFPSRVLRRSDVNWIALNIFLQHNFEETHLSSAFPPPHHSHVPLLRCPRSDSIKTLPGDPLSYIWR